MAREGKSTLERIESLVDRLRDQHVEGPEVLRALEAGLASLSEQEIESVEIWLKQTLEPIKNPQADELTRRKLVGDYYEGGKLLRPFLQARLEGKMDGSHLENFTSLLSKLGLTKGDVEYREFIDRYMNVLVSLFHTEYSESEIDDKSYVMVAYEEAMENYLKTKTNLEPRHKEIITNLYTGELFMYNDRIEALDDFLEDIKLLYKLVEQKQLSQKAGKKVLRDYIQNIGKWYKARQNALNPQGNEESSQQVRDSDYIMGAPIIVYQDGQPPRIVPNALVEAVYTELADQVIQKGLYQKSIHAILNDFEVFTHQGAIEYVEEQARQDNAVAKDLVELPSEELENLVEFEMARRELVKDQLVALISDPMIGPFTQDGLFEYIKDYKNSNKVPVELRSITVEEFIKMLNGLDDGLKQEKFVEFPSQLPTTTEAA